MNKGVLIFAHNNRELDYARMALIAGGLAKKHLKVPVSLATDESTIDWMKESGTYDSAEDLFDKIITVERPETGNNRTLHDKGYGISVPFVNGSRGSAWDVTPYERTLLIDSDFLINSDLLSNYWDVESDLLISGSYNDIVGENRIGYHDKYVSDTGVKLYWATMVMFTKNEYTRTFFNLVQHIKDNYTVFADLYRFSDRQYRNDISFSVAKHIMDGYQTTHANDLPPVFSTIDKDELHEVDEIGKFTFLITPMLDETYVAASVKGVDVHVMNKKSIVRNFDSLMRLT
jgi:hypothetical protein